MNGPRVLLNTQFAMFVEHRGASKVQARCCLFWIAATYIRNSVMSVNAWCVRGII
jgi:hypothetical protein